jgi:hypothetical protein
VVQAIENKQFREMPDFAAPMISIAYDRGAKSLVSLCEMTPHARSLIFPPLVAETKWARAANAARKWRRNQLESLKTGAEMAPLGSELLDGKRGALAGVCRWRRCGGRPQPDFCLKTGRKTTLAALQRRAVSGKRRPETDREAKLAAVK